MRLVADCEAMESSQDSLAEDIAIEWLRHCFCTLIVTCSFLNIPSSI